MNKSKKFDINLNTKHAEDVVKIRKISKKLIEKALTDPDKTINQT